MPRYKLTIEYDGGGFNGWQRQKNGASIQALLEDAVLAFCQTPAQIHAAGRTDAGVHATAQVAHVDLPKDYPAETVQHALNFHIKSPQIVVTNAQRVGDDFHARFSAIGRKYLYRIVNRPAPLALERRHAWWVPFPLDAEAMEQAAQRLLGHHDFTTFRAKECQAKSPLKTLDVLRVTRNADDIAVVAEARSFLHHQVRNMVGTLKRVGEGKWTPDDVTAALEAKDRRAGGPTAPSVGLYLTGVTY